jgi:hypothetical protein
MQSCPLLSIKSEADKYVHKILCESIQQLHINANFSFPYAGIKTFKAQQLFFVGEATQ